MGHSLVGAERTAEQPGAVELQVDRGEATQHWRFEEVDPGWFVVMARHSRLVLDVASTDQGAPLRLSTHHGGVGQQWSVTATPRGVILRSRRSGLTAQVAGGGTDEGLEIQQGADTVLLYQRLRLERVRPAAKVFRPRAGDYYRLRFAHSGLVLSVGSGSLDKGAGVVQAADREDLHQLWTFEEVASGWYRIRARHSGMVLHVSGRSTDDQAEVEQRPVRGRQNQHWSVTPEGDGYVIRARHSGSALDVSGFSLRRRRRCLPVPLDRRPEPAPAHRPGRRRGPRAGPRRAALRGWQPGDSPPAAPARHRPRRYGAGLDPAPRR